MPHLVIIAGSNGSGKSTAAPRLLKDTVHINNFVNADKIAEGLSAFEPEKAAIQAGRVMLTRIKTLANDGVNFAFETTLASRTFAKWIEKWKSRGYHVHLIFLWLSNVELAISRVSDRVRMGGHLVPEEIIRRRYHKGLKNFFNLYSLNTDSWCLYDNSDTLQSPLIASKVQNNIIIKSQKLWENLWERYHE